MTASRLIVEPLAWLLLSAAAVTLVTRRGKLAMGLGFPGFVLVGIEWWLSRLNGGAAPPSLSGSAPPSPTMVPTPAGAGGGGPPSVLLFVSLCLGALLLLGSGIWAARSRRRHTVVIGRAGGTAYPDAYPDLPRGQAPPAEPQWHRRAGADAHHEGLVPHGDLGLRRGEPLGRWDGLLWDRLCARLSDLTRDFLAHVVPKPGRAVKIDIYDPDVMWVIDGLLGASDLMVGASGDDEPGVLAAAIREAERRWFAIRDRSNGSAGAAASGASARSSGPDGDGDRPDRPSGAPATDSTARRDQNRSL